MGAPAPQRTVTEAEYLAGERDADVRHEYVDGVLFATTGASLVHGLLSTRLSARLFGHLDGTGCRVTSSDLKVRLAEGRRYYYPDLVIACEDRTDAPDDYTETAPVLVIEILSPSTQSTDRREKRLAYQSMPSLVDYLIVAQDVRALELFSRTPDGWSEATFVDGETLRLASIDLDLAVADVYGDVVPPARSAG